jgi:hypothetical protein
MGENRISMVLSIKKFRHPEERPRGASRRTQGLDPALVRGAGEALGQAEIRVLNPHLFGGDARPGQLAIFLAHLGRPRRRPQDHVLAVEADLAHLVAADPGRVRRRIDPGDEPCAIENVVAAIRAVSDLSVKVENLRIISLLRKNPDICGMPG